MSWLPLVLLCVIVAHDLLALLTRRTTWPRPRRRL